MAKAKTDMTTKIERREFLQQAHKYEDVMPIIAGWYASEKLDGIRAFWDGGISRGRTVRNVPYAAKIIVSSGKEKPWLDKPATGLWSRYGNPIWAPDEFLNQLPCCPLDGELWCGRGNWQQTSKTVKRQTPDPEAWAEVKYMIFGSPNPHMVFRTGHVKSGKNVDMEIHQPSVMQFVGGLASDPDAVIDVNDWEVIDGNLIHELAFLQEALSAIDGETPAELHKQVVLSSDPEVALRQLDELNEKALAGGAEGMVVRDPEQVWTPKRLRTVLKVKPCADMEGTIVGFTSGEETDKGSKLLGKIGAVVVRLPNGKEFNLSGYTHEEREFEDHLMGNYAADNPGQLMPPGTQGKYFKVGDEITFKYREFSDEGLPKEARYFRKRELV
jgi:DNA ligase-1